jgi:hypothetical protein
MKLDMYVVFFIRMYTEEFTVYSNTIKNHHHHHQPINVPTAGAQAFFMD